MNPFDAPLWARNPHYQTIVSALAGRKDQNRVALVRERVTLADGDFLDLDWLAEAPPEGPIILILHGLEGSSRSPYIQRLLRTCRDAGWRAVVMHFRGCSGEPNRLARGYHAGETEDLQTISELLASRHAQGLCAVGFSLGGSVLLKWLGERGMGAPVLAAAAVSVPFDLASASRRLNQGLSRVYQWVLLRWLKRSLSRKASERGQEASILSALNTFRDFDGAVTAPLHGFMGADDYYQKASCRPFLRHIAVPTLLIQAADDPFLMPNTVPTAADLSKSVRLELSPYGGHVGFVSGGFPWAPRFWLNNRLKAFLETHMPPG